MPNKSGSNRIGWNRRGPSISQQMDNARFQSEVLDPESKYWQGKVEITKDLLITSMGEVEFVEWADRVFPGETIDQATWKEIAELYDQKFRRIQAEIALGESHSWMDDPKHFKTNGVC